MSQVETLNETSKGSKRQARKARVEAFLRDFEWTWTKAVVFCLGLVFFLVIATSVLPSFWLYFADQKLKWDGSGPNGFWLKELRDAVAMGGVTVPIIAVIVLTPIMQNWRRKLRGSGGDSRPTGGYR
jgi:ABC-type Fe3+ transport system permease subunit